MLVYGLAMVVAVGIVFVAAALFRKFGHAVDDRDPGGATGSHSGAMLSALFLLVFAIAIVVPWTSADAARQNTYTEGQAIMEAYWSAEELPPAVADRTRREITAYVGFVIDKEWPLMAEGHLSAEGWRRLDALRGHVTRSPAPDDEARETRNLVLDKIRDLSTARHQRSADASAELPPGLLAITVLTGLAVIIFPFLAGARPRGMTITPLVLMAGLLGIGVYLAFDITRVFAGPLGVGPDALTSVQHELRLISGAG